MNKFYRLKGLLAPVFLSIASLLPSSVVAQAMLLPVTELKISQYAVQAEVAATDASRSFGLMHRQSLLPNHGMLFVFDSPAGHCFWMKNTPLPLSIAFIAPDGRILNIADMQPYSEQSHCPTAAALYALEMQQGWFRDRKIQAGEQITGLPKRLN
ncbi:DUF192 domain-containing protein [Alcaligenaceae bacterium]|nr:DUF192 domain-containing protein [Alcaligenaceae bacterium]